MAFASPPPAPQRGDRTTFSNRVDAFLTWLTNLIPQMNVFLSSITTLAAGGANTFAYTFDVSTADSDPGNSKVRFNSTTQNAATIIRLDNIAGNGGDMLTFMNALQAGTSNVKASLRLQKLGDVNSYLLFDITAIATASGYFNMTVSPRNSSAVSPFAANDTLILYFDPKGDKGDGGGTPTAQQIRDAIGTLGIANGGTGATTASTALANLGGYAKTGGPMSGNVGFLNGVGVFGTDAQGTSRQIMKMDSDNNVNCVLGPTGWNWYNVGGTTIVARIDNTGLFSPGGQILFKNGLGIQMTDAQGNARNVSYIGADNWLNFFGATAGTRWFNAAANTTIMSLSDAGALVAVSMTSSSDERKKKNWRHLTDAQLDALAGLQDVGLFDWIDGSGTSLGGPAQQIRAIIPEAVHEDADGWLSVNYSALAFVMAHGALRRSKAAS